MDIKELNKILATVKTPTVQVTPQTVEEPKAPTIDERRAKYGDLFEVHDKAQARLNELEELYAPLRKEYDDLRAKMSPIEDRLRQLTLAIKEISPEMAKCKNIVAAIHRATGSKGISVESGGVVTR
jgi:chromosome segregation ATPase